MEGNLCLLELCDLRQFLDSSSLVFLEDERPDLWSPFLKSFSMEFRKMPPRVLLGHCEL